MYAKIQTLLPTPVALAESDNLLEFGLDSLKIMRLANEWRRAGAPVTFARLMERPCLRDWLALLRQPGDSPSPGAVEAACPEDEAAAFPLTDVQYAYWIGRRDGQTLGGVGCHAYLEFDGRDIDPRRLETAWKRLFRHHPMLRARFLADGTQTIGETAHGDTVVVHDLRQADREIVESHLVGLRERLSHRRLAVEDGEVAGLSLTLLPQGRARLHLDVDLLVADVQSLHILLRDLAAGYARDAAPQAPVDWSFSRCLARMVAQRQGDREAAASYWRNRLDTLPGAPGLPLRQKPEALDVPVFRRRQHRLDPRVWQVIRSRAAAYRTTPAMVLLTMYAQVLGCWSAQPRFLINIPLFDRLADMPGIEDVVADFTTVLLLEVACRAGDSFLDALNDIKNQFRNDVAHAVYSGVQVQRDLARMRQGERLLAPVVFACNLGTPLLTQEFREHLGELSFMVSQTPQVWLDFQIYETDDTLLLAWDAVEGLFPEGMVDAMFAASVRLAQWLARDGNDWTTMPSLLPVDQEKRRARGLVPAVSRQSRCLHLSFFAQAARTPKRIALVEGDAGPGLGYGALASTALGVAAALKDSGVTPGEPVAVVLPRGTAQITAVLGILAAGAFYVPIGTGQPALRRDRILQKAAVRFVITDAVRGQVPWPDGTVVLDVAQAIGREPLPAPVAVAPGETAYVIFTSGSTGEPKGVEVSHAAAWNTIKAINTIYGVRDTDRALAVSALDFDLSVYDIFGLLAVGGSLVLLDDASHRDAARWLSLIEAHGITLWNSVPTLLEMLLVAAEGQGRRDLPLRQTLLSGDWIGLDLPQRLQNVAPGCRLAALGGATEAAIWSNHCDVTLPLPGHWISIPYGRPLPSQVYRVVDTLGRDCPDWVPGELWIGGAGVAKGYRGSPELTAQRFVEAGGLRWYRTGDQGRFWPDGTIEFLGRQDFQVKIRGHRIELGEIEAALLRHSEVGSAVVTVVEGDKGSRHLAGHVVPAAPVGRGPAGDGLERKLTDHLVGQLPDFMVPRIWNILPALPLTANGKVDRKALAALVAGSADEAPGFAAPETETEKRLAAIWASVLGTGPVGRHDSFFELGGDSLVGTRLVAAVHRDMHWQLPLEKLFATPTVAELAAGMDAVSGPDSEAGSDAAGLPAIVPDPASLHAPFPLTEIQHAYWVGRNRELELGNVAALFYYELDCAHLDLAALGRAWARVVARHAMLRAVILPDGSQRILETVPDATFPTADLSGLSPQARQAALEAVRRDMSTRMLPADRWPLFDIRVSLLGGGKQRLHVGFDCLIVDAWSLSLLMRDWHRFYAEGDASLPEVPLSFRDYVLAAQALPQTARYERDRDYWLNRLDTLPPAPDLPLAKAPSDIETPRFRRRGFTLGKTAWDALKRRARAHEITASGVLAAVYAEVLGQWSRNQAFTINLTLFNRLPMHAQVEDIVGDFTSLTLLAVENDHEETFLARAVHKQRQLLRDLDHRSYNGVLALREIARRRGEFSRAAMPVVFTSALGMGSLGNDAGFGLFGTMGYSVSQTPQVWLDCQAYESDGEAVLTWDAVDGLFPEGMIDDMFQGFCALLVRLAEDDRAWHAPVPSLAPEAHLRRRRAVNATDVPVSQALLHTLVQEQAQARPDALAVVAPDRCLRHGELGAYAATLGHLLRARGAKPGELVAVVMDKGWEQVAGVLGVLGAGAAYLPLDPALPSKRMRHLLADARVRVVLTQTWLMGRIQWPEGVELVAVDTLVPRETTPPKPVQSPEDLAYVIYTSGSTGQPKGVMIDHRGAGNTILDINSRFAVGPSDRVLALSNLHFDLSVYDMFGILAAGGAIVLPRADLARDPAHWAALMREHGVTLWNSVPMMLQMLVESAAGRAEGALASLRAVLLSGDWIPLDLPGAVRALAPGLRVSGLGGATEASIWSNIFDVDALAPYWKSIPYGKPLANQRYHVLDQAFRDRPDWVPGNLYIAGVGLARGYWGDGPKTDAAFVTHPVTGERLYRTGDLGRYLPDGNIEFLGREDTQVKVGGHRIELGEIEAVLERNGLVQRAVALTTGAPAVLVAAAVVAPDRLEDPGIEEELARFLGEHLPEYMIPGKIMPLAALPLNDNGKVDRKALATALEGHRPRQRASEPESPSGELERRLAAIWMEHLGLGNISRHDDFFHLGGDSLKATRIIRQLHALELVPEDVSLRAFFAAPTIARFADQLLSLDRRVASARAPQNNHFEEGAL
ncbi:amino acid adenylation domain-containing protein [Solidesulfovibrio sp. C21]|uniref:amino acid adenylation domain-containing protein n=1 Tax=Solidesulfovibrio sp. C21 TaxID=3398613 RepID=UPI0039FD91EB